MSVAVPDVFGCFSSRMHPVFCFPVCHLTPKKHPEQCRDAHSYPKPLGASESWLFSAVLRPDLGIFRPKLGRAALPGHRKMQHLEVPSLSTDPKPHQSPNPNYINYKINHSFAYCSYNLHPESHMSLPAASSFINESKKSC